MVHMYQVVDPPPQTALPFGLLSVVQPLDGASDHWANGIMWQSRLPSASLTYDECVAVTGTAAPPPPASKASNVTKTLRAATAFTAYVELDCSPVGAGDLADYVKGVYPVVEPYPVENAFWTGTVGGVRAAFPHLAAAATVSDSDGNLLQTVPVTGGPFKPANALGFLEANMAACLPTVGVVHVPRRALPVFPTVIARDGGLLKTTGGNLVAAGSGYPGTAPDGSAAAASQAWIYGTGPVFGKWGDVRVLGPPGALDRAKNTMKIITERTYLLGWDTCHVGVLVDLS